MIVVLISYTIMVPIRVFSVKGTNYGSQRGATVRRHDVTFLLAKVLVS